MNILTNPIHQVHGREYYLLWPHKHLFSSITPNLELLFFIIVLALLKYHKQPHIYLVVFFSSVKDKVSFLVLHGVSSVKEHTMWTLGTTGCSTFSRMLAPSSMFKCFRNVFSIFYPLHFSVLSVILQLTESQPWQHLNTAYQRQESAPGNDTCYTQIPFSQGIRSFLYPNYFCISR